LSQEGEDVMVIKEKSVESGEIGRRQGTTLNYGSVEGQLIELHEVEDHGLEITVEDRAFKVRVTARLYGDWVQIAKDALGGRILIEGRVLRDADRGRPIRILDVTTFEPLGPIVDGALLSVAGIWEAPPGYEIITARDPEFSDPSEHA